MTTTDQQEDGGARDNKRYQKVPPEHIVSYLQDSDIEVLFAPNRSWHANMFLPVAFKHGFLLGGSMTYVDHEAESQEDMRCMRDTLTEITVDTVTYTGKANTDLLLDFFDSFGTADEVIAERKPHNKVYLRAFFD